MAGGPPGLEWLADGRRIMMRAREVAVYLGHTARFENMAMEEGEVSVLEVLANSDGDRSKTASFLGGIVD